MLGRRLRLAGVALAWEALWRTLWPAAALAGAFLAMAGLGVFDAVGPLAHAALLAGFAAAFVALLARLRRLRLPSSAAARRRLETDGGAAHRPIGALDDRPAWGEGDPAVAALWEAHRRRLLATARQLRPRWPRPGVAARDRFALRGLVLLGLFVALVVAGGDLSYRLRAALVPQLALGGPSAPVSIDLYVTPPDYTGRPPLYLAAAGGVTGEAGAEAATPLRIPTGSRVTARIGGTDDAELVLGTTAHPVEPDGTVEAVITAGDRIALAVGGDILASWPVEILPDAPPTIRFAADPSVTERQALRLDWLALDDWGVASLSAAVSLLPGAPAALDATPLVLPMPAPRPAATEARGTAYEDLTAHPWAGQRVSVVLTALDAIGQIGRSAPVELVLPERGFRHPVARAIIEARRALDWRMASPAAIAEAIDDIALRPGAYGEDRTVFLALRIASRRLTGAPEAVEADRASVRDLLWETALRVEDGGLSLAEQSVRESARALQDALERRADPETVAALTEALREAMARYLQELARAAVEGRLPMAVPSEGMAGQALDPAALDRMLEEIGRAASEGRQDAAQSLLSQLQAMMEGLSTAMPSPEQLAARQEAAALQRDLQALLAEQRGLRDDVFRNSGQAGQDPSLAPEGGADGGGMPGVAEQQAVRRALGELMRRMGELTGDIPAGFGAAEQAMRQAEQALGSPWPEDALGPQGEAIDALGRGMQDLAESMMAQGMTGPGIGMSAGQDGGGRRPGPGPGGTDPLGRPSGQGEGFAYDEVEVPGLSGVERAREILDELRRRLDDRRRPATERGYIERLLRHF